MYPGCESFFLFGVLFAAPLHAAAPVPSADLVVYGGTASGVMTAYSAAREGLHVVLLEPGVHLGEWSPRPLGNRSRTLHHHWRVRRDFYMKAAARYGVHDLDHPENWRSEPHVDEEIFRTMLQDGGVAVHFHAPARTPRRQTAWQTSRFDNDSGWQTLAGKDLCRLQL